MFSHKKVSRVIAPEICMYFYTYIVFVLIKYLLGLYGLAWGPGRVT